MSVLLKICGLVRCEDLLAAVEAGADYVGAVAVTSSPRRLDAEAVRKLFGAVPRGTAERVIVIAGMTPSDAVDLARYVRADIIQLHGGETPEYARALRGFGIWRAYHLRSDDDIEAAANYPCETIVADSAQGGSGVCCDWDLVGRLARRRRVLAAGGITPQNATAALAATGADGVDVSSGVEAAVGIKSSEKIFQLARSIKQ